MFTPIGNQKLLSVPPHAALPSFKVWSGPRPSSGGDFFRLTPARGFWAVTSAGTFRAGLPGGAFHARVGHRLPTSDAMNSFPATTPPHQPHKFTPVTLATRKTVNASEVGHLQRGTAPEWGAQRGVPPASPGSHSPRAEAESRPAGCL